MDEKGEEVPEGKEEGGADAEAIANKLSVFVLLELLASAYVIKLRGW